MRSQGIAPSTARSSSSSTSCTPCPRRAAEGAQYAPNMLNPALARGELGCLGLHYLDEYRKRIGEGKALERPLPPSSSASRVGVADTSRILLASRIIRGSTTASGIATRR